MKKTLMVTGSALLIAALSLSGCRPSLWLNERDVRGETITYITESNGKDYVTYVFDDTGRAGEYETGSFDWDYPTEEAFNSGKHTEKKWIMTEGQKGIFDWDPETLLMTKTLNQAWGVAQGATPIYSDMSGDHFAEGDYDWQDMKYGLIGPSAGDDDSASIVWETYFIPNADNPELEIMKRIEEGSNSWEYYFKYTEIKTEGGVTTTTYTEIKMITEIAATAVTWSSEKDDYEKVGNADPDVTTNIEEKEYSVIDIFSVGEETGDKEFEDIWKEGNEASLLLSRTRRTIIRYTDGSPPEKPPVDPDTGIGETVEGSGDYYKIYEYGGETKKMSLAHFGDFLVSSNSFGSASRGLP